MLNIRVDNILKCGFKSELNCVFYPKIQSKLRDDGAELSQGMGTLARKNDEVAFLACFGQSHKVRRSRQQLWEQSPFRYKTPWKPMINGGERGIRTLDTLASIPVFETGAFNRTLPPLHCVISYLDSTLKSK